MNGRMKLLEKKKQDSRKNGIIIKKMLRKS